MTENLRICLWSGPRNISTALMYSFAQRADTVVYDEPLYAHYLAHSPAREYHPGAEEVLASQENDGEKVIADLILGQHARPVAFFKNMTHHLPGLKTDFLKNTRNVLLTRHPREMLISFSKVIHQPTMADVGYAAHLQLLELLASYGQTPLVLDGTQVLLNPRQVLGKLCAQLEIPFDAAMLSWQAGARPEDGIWAKYWYRQVHQSTGFLPYQPSDLPFPSHLQPLLEECLPIYEALQARAITF